MDTSSLLARSRKGYADDWHAWEDPDVPEYLSPTWYLLDRHVHGGRAGRTALVADDVPYTYADLLGMVERIATGLRQFGVPRGGRLLMVGTDSVEFVALWLACVRAGIVPVVVSDAVKAPQLA